MRIIAGEHRGRPLKALKGDVARPTTDRVREALMSTLASTRGGLGGAVVLDAFAGSGALGLEALSRAAAHATFYERDAAVLRTLSANVASLGIAETRFALCRADILKSPPRDAVSPFDIVFLDPPYAYEASRMGALLCALDEAALLAAEALISYEHAKSDDSAVVQAFGPLQWEIVSHKGYGDTAVDILRRRT
ncbi:MAG: 16S rRNA (guanine(966)-N(2))-methyltransferase RsmD [Eggerthellaceae bacterium]|nr:16S rRNA (guanine(966)-N(2))-methyltransferase RsmD [Eggerthellaceae bacterium]MDR2716369.1 16S rRNA (guanine(966)-N(2))-methyltransferase RsmD [Coriobacteriaceae bacterium]